MKAKEDELKHEDELKRENELKRHKHYKHLKSLKDNRYRIKKLRFKIPVRPLLVQSLIAFLLNFILLLSAVELFNLYNYGNHVLLPQALIASFISAFLFLLLRIVLTIHQFQDVEVKIFSPCDKKYEELIKDIKYKKSEVLDLLFKVCIVFIPFIAIALTAQIFNVLQKEFLLKACLIIANIFILILAAAPILFLFVFCLYCLIHSRSNEHDNSQKEPIDRLKKLLSFDNDKNYHPIFAQYEKKTTVIKALNSDNERHASNINAVINGINKITRKDEIHEILEYEYCLSYSNLQYWLKFLPTSRCLHPIYLLRRKNKRFVMDGVKTKSQEYKLLDAFKTVLNDPNYLPLEKLGYKEYDNDVLKCIQDFHVYQGTVGDLSEGHKISVELITN